MVCLVEFGWLAVRIDRSAALGVAPHAITRAAVPGRGTCVPRTHICAGERDKTFRDRRKSGTVRLTTGPPHDAPMSLRASASPDSRLQGPAAEA